MIMATTIAQTTANRIRTRKLLLVLISLCCAFPALVSGQSKTSCDQERAVQEQLIREAQVRPYVVRRISIDGNIYIRDREFRNRFVLNEGDIFTRAGLLKSLQNASRMHSIYPIGLRNVEVQLDRERYDVILLFCVRERSRQKQK